MTNLMGPLEPELKEISTSGCFLKEGFGAEFDIQNSFESRSIKKGENSVLNFYQGYFSP